MEIFPGLWIIERHGQAYLYREADRFTLVDAGITGIAPKIFDALGAQGGRPEQLHTIILTHHHADHMGGCAELVESTDAQVMAHALEAPVIRGDQQPPEAQITEIERPFHEQAVKATPPAAPARVDRELDDGDEIDLGGGALVVHVPGHTPGSIALYLPAKRVLFTGDAAARLPDDRVIAGVFNVDPAQTRESFCKLAELDFDVACFGHGKPLDKDASRAFRRAAERLG
ncbi:MAG: MBL fold metallo-hydrolase [Chloroflexi bacterium]|nr:MBL fold metallo-hydrolase [Chloroflexota bacterium]MCH8066110.1 MBL fold metallo-hydrolase [Chloroflexota bacterium]